MAILAERVASMRAIAVVCAPPGFGKSELFHVAKALAGRDAQVRIVRFDAARHRADPRAAAEAVLQARTHDIVIVDGLYGADADALAEAMMLRFPAPDSPRVWIALRHLKELALARFMVDGTADVIDWQSLRLTDAEGRAHVDRVPPRFRKLVGALAKNWPAACALLCRWAQQAAAEEADWDVAAILAACGLDDYIEQEIVPLLSAEELDALVHASITETIEVSPEKRGIARSHALQAVVGASVKIAGLIERNGNQLVLHPALRHWLATRFETLPKERQIETLARAAREFAARDDLVVAARLFRGAGMEEEIERVVIERGSLLIWMTHGFAAIREVVEQAGEPHVERSSVLQMMRCIVLMKTGRIAEAQRHFAAIHIDEADLTPILERDREITRITLLVYGCGPQRGDDLERFRSIVARTASEPGWKSLLSTLSCMLNAQRAQFDAALANLIEARVHARSADSRYNLLFLSLHEANIHLAQGALKEARAALGEARKRWRQEFADDRGAETVMSALMASLEYELGQLTSARSSVRKSAYRMPDSEAWFDIYVAAYEPMARIIVTDHGTGPAHEALADQRRKLIAQGLPRVAAMLQNLAIVLAGEQWVRDGTMPGDTLQGLAALDAVPAWQEQEMFGLASAYMAMWKGRVDEAERLLRDGIKSSDERKLARSSLRYRLALVTLLLKKSDERADAELRHALLLGARLGARQVFLHTLNQELAAAMTRLAEAAEGRRSGLKRFVGALRAPRRITGNHGELSLSARELDVLRALDEGGSDKVLGRLLDISEHGVRFHLKSIYRKLNVHDRLSAIHRAKEIGVI
ncbi:response regulator transcription factor [Hephaestia sp. GCM10023244]|uniref:helix-turn-helix transcriptional regulator n=1 Tax=unclassified Hephaestia TaxID=2631281 RepID=UPI0020777813|nr:LuxR C-terminal-related transcriptional regulator [Hephaestia sp. MAHUQ-44]MCM8732475.1 LuxR C-terminal-related transcriptional regulator [Hephaestia sp. MAHUQ-44]